MNTTLETRTGSLIEVTKDKDRYYNEYYVLRISGKEITRVVPEDKLRMSHLVRFLDLIESENK